MLAFLYFAGDNSTFSNHRMLVYRTLIILSIMQVNRFQLSHYISVSWSYLDSTYYILDYDSWHWHIEDTLVERRNNRWKDKMPSLTYIHQGSQQTPWDMQSSYACNASNWIEYIFTFHLVDTYQRKWTVSYSVYELWFYFKSLCVKVCQKTKLITSHHFQRYLDETEFTTNYQTNANNNGFSSI